MQIEILIVSSMAALGRLFPDCLVGSMFIDRVGALYLQRGESQCHLTMESLARFFEHSGVLAVALDADETVVGVGTSVCCVNLNEAHIECRDVMADLSLSKKDSSMIEREIKGRLLREALKTSQRFVMLPSEA